MKRPLLFAALILAAAEARPAAAEAPPAPAIKLVAAGKGALRPLRFTPKKGARQTLVTTSQDSSAKGLRGKLPPVEPEPAIRLTSDVEVTDVTAAGDVRSTFVYRKLEAVEDRTTPPEVARRLTGMLGALDGTRGHAVVTSRGVVKSSDLEIPKAATPELRQNLESLRSMASQIAAPMPEEPIGVGAKWDMRLTVTVGELTVQQQSSHELVELDGTRGKIKIALKQQGKGSGSGNLTMTSTGHGEISFDLTRAVPVQARLEMRTEVELDFDGKRLAMLKTSVTTMMAR